MMETAEASLSPRTLQRSMVVLMAVCTGLAVSSMYYSQPLLSDIRKSLHMGTATAGLIVSLTQVGYVGGLCLLVPLGDLFPRRRLIPLMLTGVGAFLGLIAVAPSAPILLIGCVAAGALSVAAQITVALAATLASDEERGRVVGTVMGGLLLGILLARTAAGYLAELGSWRTPYWIAGAVMIGLAAVMVVRLPGEPDRARVPYPDLLKSIVSILREEPVLRLRAAYGAMAFGAFSALWTPLAFLLSGSPYRYAASTIGLFGLLGVAGALTATLAGRIADRGGARQMTGITAIAMLVSWIPIVLGRHRLLPLVIGVVLLDFAVQGLHITNQSQIYRLRPEARSRITSAYMAIYFVGGVAGSLGSSWAYSSYGWAGVSAVGAAFGLIAVVLWVVTAMGRSAPGPAVAV